VTINNIVNISLLDSGLIKINYSVFNINDLLDYLYKYFTIQAVNQNLEFLTQTKLSTDEARYL
jgi:signal transduction histidine kinase